LGGFLADHVLLEDRVDLARLRQVLEFEAGRSGELLIDDLVTEIDALVADVDAGAGDQLLDLALRLPAEAAEELFVGFGWACHSGLSSLSGYRRPLARSLDRGRSRLDGYQLLPRPPGP